MKKRISLIKAIALGLTTCAVSSCTLKVKTEVDIKKTLTYNIGDTKFSMVEVKGGNFLLGAQTTDAKQPNYDPQAAERETPVTEQKVETFWLGNTEVTQGLWKAVMGTPLGWNDSLGIGDSLPAYNVSHDEAMNFIAILNDRLHKEDQLKPEQNFCLPTEVEWEYAAKGGCKSKNYLYAGSSDANEVGWFDQNSNLKAHNVAQKKPNSLGLYDMTGNVWEWCSNYKYDYAQPEEPAEKTFTIRGGSYGYRVHGARNTCRGYNFGWYKDGNIGFRLCLK